MEKKTENDLYKAIGFGSVLEHRARLYAKTGRLFVPAIFCQKKVKNEPFCRQGRLHYNHSRKMQLQGFGREFV